MTNGEAEKKKDYRRAVLLQILFLTMSLLTADTLRLFDIEAKGFLFDAVFHVLGGIYLVALCDMLRNYTDSKALVRVSFGLLGVAFLILVGVNLVFSPSHHAASLWRMVAHGLLALIQIEVIAFAPAAFSDDHLDSFATLLLDLFTPTAKARLDFAHSNLRAPQLHYLSVEGSQFLLST